MLSCVYGQNQLGRQPLNSPQGNIGHANNTIWNQQTLDTQKPCQNWTANTVLPPQTTHLPVCAVDTVQQTTNSSAVSYQAVSSQRTAVRLTNNCDLTAKPTETRQNSFSNPQCRNNRLPVPRINIVTKEAFQQKPSFTDVISQKRHALTQKGMLFVIRHRLIRNLLETKKLPTSITSCSTSATSPSNEAATKPNRQHSTLNSSNDSSMQGLSLSEHTHQQPTPVSPTVNSSEGSACYIPLKAAKQLVNPANDTEEQMLRQKEIARIEDFLRQPVPATSNDCLPQNNPSHHSEKQSGGQDRVTTQSESFYSNASQSLDICGFALPATTHSVAQRIHDRVDSSCQSSPPNYIYVPATRHGYEIGDKASKGFFNQSDRVSTVRRIGFSNETNIQQKSKTYVTEEMNWQMPRSVALNDGLIIPSSGNTDQGCIAAIQESHQVARRPTSSNKCSQLIVNSATITSKSDSEKLIFQADINNKMDLCQTEGSKEQVDHLDSVPTVPWTIDKLAELILFGEKAQAGLNQNSSVLNVDKKNLDLFWQSRNKNRVKRLKMAWYKDLMTEVKQFCKAHVTSDTVLVSEMEQSFWKQQKNCYHVLKDEDDLSAFSSPFQSSWLNGNEQLDDIDKEFGFPMSLKHNFLKLKSQSQPTKDRIVKTIPAHSESEVRNKSVLQAEIETIDLTGEDQAVEVTSPKTPISSDSETADSNDHYYSFEIKVLPPEQAKLVFEQLQTDVPENVVIDSQPETIRSAMEEEVLQAKEVALIGSDLEIESCAAILQVCCISRWKDMICGSESPSLCTCQCKHKESDDSTDKSVDDIDDKEDYPCVAGFNGKPQSNIAKEIENLVEENQSVEENHGQSRSTTADMEESSLETEKEQRQIDQKAVSQTDCLKGKPETPERQQKRPSSHDTSYPMNKKLKTHKPFVGIDSPYKPEASNTVQLALFGSESQNRILVSPNIKRCFSSLADGVQRPPECIKLNLSAKRPKRDSASLREYSINQWILKNRDIVANKVWQRNKVKTGDCILSSSSAPFHTIRSSSSTRGGCTEELTGSPKRRVSHQNVKLCISLGKKSHHHGDKHRETKILDAATSGQPADHKRCSSENTSHDVMPSRGDTNQTFRLLQKSLPSKDHCRRQQATKDSVPSERSVDRKDNTGSKQTVSKTSSLFQEFQKKYKMKNEVKVIRRQTA